MSKLAHSGNADMDAIERQGRALDERESRQEEEHTPLPWHKDIYGHIGDSKGTNIASTWTTSDENYPEGRPYRANAAFIVRACNAHYDLLAALKEVVAIADRKTDEFDRARAAIAKAEGK